MRVAYFDLGFSREQYGLQPTRYGGGAVAARYLKEDPEVDMTIFAPDESFLNVGPTEWSGRVKKGIPLGSGVREQLARGWPITELFRLLPVGPFDLILHGHTCFALNRGSFRGAMCHWSGFDGSAGHPGNDYVLLYDPSFRAQFGERAKYVRIGKPVPTTFTSSVKEDFVCQVSRHDDHMGSVELAKQCLQYGIKGVFAGPIHGSYPLRDYIDGKTTVYLGEIDEATKLDLYRRARLCALLANWDLPFNQSLIEAQGQGTPIYVNQRGPFLKTYLKEGVNGFAAHSPKDGIDWWITLDVAFNLARDIDQRACWAAAREYDVSVMCRTFKQAFTEIVAEWRAEHP